MAEWLQASARVARKEFRTFFATPAAYLFLGAFLAVTLFVFFWVETFFARNIADVRPLFQWMPVLLIFLVAALTMRAWSEERRAGTLETLLTAPVRPLAVVLGKFAASMGLVIIALALTLPLPITVAVLGPLDWGPVIGGYVATLFLAAAYVAIGLYTSARTDNPIVALILTVLLGGIFYLIGSDVLTTLFGHRTAGWLALLGTGTRFDAITRGVLDLRDLYYYLSIVGVFLALNLFGLERLRWAGNPSGRRHRLWGWVTGLAAANFIAANLWLAPIGWARADLTEGNLYSISDATRQQLAQLREPLLIRGYFSAKTHPLLAPLVPALEDLLAEYRVAAGGRVRVEFIDPTRDREAEEEAAARYGIQPVPFQTADRYQAAVVNSYFDVVVAYGDEYETLGFRDLIEVKLRGEGDLDVVLKDPEYAITRAIRKVVSAYQAGGTPFETLNGPVRFNAYISPPERLPEQLRQLRTDLEAVVAALEAQAGGKLQVSFADPDAQDGRLAQELARTYGLGPQVASILDPTPFWFYMVLEADGETVQVPLPERLDKAALEQSIDAALKRLAPGFLKTVGVLKPAAVGAAAASYGQLEQILQENVRVRDVDLLDGTVPEDVDLLLVLSPRGLEEKQRFAIDQFLMRGGSVVLASSPYKVEVAGSLRASKQPSGLEEWLAHHGLTIEEGLVLDARSAALPVPVERQVGGLMFRELRMVPYAPFADLRGAGINQESPITGNLDQVTVSWASPITVDAETNAGRTVTRLLTSSPRSWVSEDLDLVPDFAAYPETGFPTGGRAEPHLLAVAVEGRFTSFYEGKPSPLAQEEAPDEAPGGGDDPQGQAEAADDLVQEEAPVITGVIERSPESARLVLVASDAFASDAALTLASQGLNTQYTKPADFLQNAIDWSLEDASLLSLRGRTRLARTLEPLPEGGQRLWEYANYGLAVLGVLGVWGWRRGVRRAERTYQRKILAEV